MLFRMIKISNACFQFIGRIGRNFHTFFVVEHVQKLV